MFLGASDNLAQSDGDGPGFTIKKSIDWEALFNDAEDFLLVAAMADAQLPVGDAVGMLAYGGAWLGRVIFGASKMTRAFFQGAKYSSKVLRQMNKTDDLYHAFPKSVDGYAIKFGKSFSRGGADGNVYQWLRLEGTWGGKAGYFEYIKDANGVINHRMFIAY